MDSILPIDIAKEYEVDTDMVRFVTRAPIRREVDLRRIRMSDVPMLVEQGYLKKKGSTESKAKAEPKPEKSEKNDKKK